MKKILLASILAAAAAGFLAFGTPYQVASSLRSAIAERDADAFGERVDYLAVKAKMKADARREAQDALGALGSAAAEMDSAKGAGASSSGLAGDALAKPPSRDLANAASSALGQLADALIDRVVTPGRVMAAMGAGKAGGRAGDVSAHWTVRQKSLARFDLVATAQDASPDDEPIRFVFERKGALDWKLVAIE